jgi:DNA-binding response OmpR family regulator
MSLILVIDDDDLIRSLVQRVLEKDGHSVASAADGERGLAAFRAVKPDLVITDIIMPEKEGIWMIRQIRQDSTTARILAMSGGGSVIKDDVLDLARQLGADGTIAKPFSAMELLEKVQATLVPWTVPPLARYPLSAPNSAALRSDSAL